MQGTIFAAFNIRDQVSFIIFCMNIDTLLFLILCMDNLYGERVIPVEPHYNEDYLVLLGFLLYQG